MRDFASMTADEREAAIRVNERLLAGEIKIDTRRCIVCNGDVLVGRNTRIEYKNITNPHFLLTDGQISEGFEIAVCQSMCRGSGCICSLDELERLNPLLATEYREGKKVFLVGGRATVFVSGRPYRTEKLPVKLSERYRQRIQEEIKELRSCA